MNEYTDAEIREMDERLVKQHGAAGEVYGIVWKVVYTHIGYSARMSHEVGMAAVNAYLERISAK